MTTEEKKALRRQYQDARRLVAQALIRRDPIGLVGMGAPIDEYDPEVGTIVPRLWSARTRDEVKAIVHEEFLHWFGSPLAGELEEYSEPAREIWEGWLVVRARALCEHADVEVVKPSESRVRLEERELQPETIVRIGERFFVETEDDPGKWWMGERDAGGRIVVWGQYGNYEEAFGQH